MTHATQIQPLIIQSSVSTRENDPAQESMFDLDCITLLCNLESLMSEFRQKQIGDRIETATVTANAILLKLLEFSEERFEEQQATVVQEQIRAAMDCREQHVAALRKRSWTFALKSLISSKAVDPISVEAYDKLGKCLIATCGIVFTEMQRLLRNDSQVRSQIEQSALTFLEELKGSWL